MPATHRKPPKPRRTHNLGGCDACRRRHVKCDQTKPQCGVCRSAQLECIYPSPIRWASLATGSTTGKQRAAPRGHRRKEPGRTVASDVDQSEASVAVGERVVSSAQQSLGTVPDQTTPCLGSSNFVEHGLKAPLDSMHVGSANALAFGSGRPTSSDTVDPMVDWNWLFDVSTGLGWNDLFDSAGPLSMSAIPEQMLGSDIDAQLYDCESIEHQAIPQEIHADYPVLDQPHQWQEHALPAEATALDPPPSYSVTSDFSEAAVLEDAKALLKHFREEVIPLFSPIPMASKSPWEIMHWRAAVQTHADMTFLETSHVTHASKANLFAVLGCSAYMMMRRKTGNPISEQNLSQILDFSSKRAKADMQESLRLEVAGERKAKYKDQLMGLLSLIALETLMGNPGNARCYLIDAERLLRLRGLAKREVSRRARLLHHVYTWLRIIGESSFVLHDHKKSALRSRIENMLSKDAVIAGLSPSSDRSKTTKGEYSELDDFLRTETRGTDSDSDVTTPKDQDAGLRDIHLADARQWAQTLYMEVYGIPEIWLSLVSQVTRIANILDFLENSSIPLPSAMDKSLQRKLNRLEQKVCSFSAQHSSISAPSYMGESLRSTPSRSQQAMLRAMSSGLVIFFYRRIRKVHPWILQAHVNDVITALKDFGQSQEDLAQNTSGTIGTPWPAFIAGCEAMSPEPREWLHTWIENAACRSRSTGFLNCRQVMQQVWLERDAACNAGKHQSRGSGKEEGLCSWVDILRQQNLWVMLY